MLKFLLKFRHLSQYLLFLLIALGIHSQNFGKEYVLDDIYGIRDNPAVRSLGMIPKYFTDPHTLTTLRENADYRPILQITYALNYWMSGTSMWSWHLTQVLLHGLVGIFISIFALRLFGTHWARGTIQDSKRSALVVGLIFLIHPYTAGVVNYLWARSSLLVAVFLVPSLNYFLMALDELRESPPQANAVSRSWVVSIVLFSLALFTKVEAIGGLGVLLILFLLDSWSPGSSVWACVKRLSFRRAVRVFWPYLGVTIFYFLIRESIVGEDIVKARQMPDVTSFQYLLTQTTAWWHYVLRWLAPVKLVADDLTYPVFRSLVEPRVIFAISGWVIFGCLATAWFSRVPLFWVSAVSALALISPTSSIAPLSEMVNEHRPYLPLAVLSLGVIPPCLSFLESEGVRKFRFLLLSLIAVSLTLLTWERNRVFATYESFWADVVKKAPSSRSLMNYGLILMGRGDYLKSLDYFNRAAVEAPYWHILKINMALAHEGLGHLEEATKNLDEAVAYDRYGILALSFRGEYRARHKQYAGAKDDLERVVNLASDRYRILKNLARASAGLGDWKSALSYTEQCYQNNQRQMFLDVVEIANPFWESKSSYENGILYFEGLKKLLGQQPWIDTNIRNLKLAIEGSRKK